MKRFSFIMLAAVLFATACSDNNYTLVGSVPQWCDDDIVNIIDFNSQQLIGTIPLKDQKFEYKGKIDSSSVLVLFPSDESVQWTVILEPGTIYLNPYLGYATGTPLNDAVVEYDKVSVSLQYSMSADEYLEAVREKSNAFINEHINDVAGAYVLMSSLSCHTDDEVKDFIDRCGPVFYGSNLIKALQRKYPFLKKDSE